MQSVLGIFDSHAAAEQAVQGLLAAPIAAPSIIFLSGEAGKAQVENLTTTDTERDGMGEVVGGVVGNRCRFGAGRRDCQFVCSWSGHHLRRRLGS